MDKKSEQRQAQTLSPGELRVYFIRQGLRYTVWLRQKRQEAEEEGLTLEELLESEDGVIEDDPSREDACRYF